MKRAATLGITLIVWAAAQATELEARPDNHEPHGIWTTVENLSSMALDGELLSVELKLKGTCIDPAEVEVRLPEVEYLTWPEQPETYGYPSRYIERRGEWKDGYVVLKFYPSDAGESCLAAIAITATPPPSLPAPGVEIPRSLPAYPWPPNE